MLTKPLSISTANSGVGSST
ncbi:hypothetical protein D037_3419A, partial [Vibrio parahaemolyticus IDH02640]